MLYRLAGNSGAGQGGRVRALALERAWAGGEAAAALAAQAAAALPPPPLPAATERAAAAAHHLLHQYLQVRDPHTYTHTSISLMTRLDLLALYVFLLDVKLK